MKDEAELMQRIGQQVRAARKATGMSQAQLAEKVNYTRASIANLEAGRQSLSLGKLVLLMGVLKLDLFAAANNEPSQESPYTWIETLFDVRCSCGENTVSEPCLSKGAAEVARRNHAARHARDRRR